MQIRVGNTGQVPHADTCGQCTVGLLAKLAEPCYLGLVVTLGARRCEAGRSDVEARKVFGTQEARAASPFYRIQSIKPPVSVSIQRPDTASPSDNGHITAGYAGHTLQHNRDTPPSATAQRRP